MNEPATEEGPAPAPPSSLKRRAVTGTLLSLANVGGAQILRLIGNVITTRILSPDDYGLMWMLLIFNQLLQMMSDVGILPNIIQHPRGDERAFLDTAWTIQVVRGMALSLIAAIAAWPYAQFCGEPLIFELVLVSSIQATVVGLESTKLATLNRHIQVGRLVALNLISQVVTMAVMIGWALVHPTVWALLAGAIAGEVVKTVLSYWIVRGPNNRFRWEKEAVAVIFGFGKWIFVSTLVTYVGLRFDGIMLTRLQALELVDLSQLGVYNIGQSLAALPILVTGQVVIWVLLPALSEAFRDDIHAFAENVRRARRVLNAAGVLLVAGTAIGAPAFFRLVYDDRYEDAGWMVQLLMVPTWFFFLQETSIRIQLAMGFARPQMTANVAKLLGTVPGAIGGFYLGGLPGLILGTALGALTGYLAVAWGLRARGIPIFVSDMKWTALGAVLGAAGGYLPWWLAERTALDGLWLSVGIGALVLLPYGGWSARVVLQEIRARR